MNKYENGVIKHQIQLEAYKNGQANEIISLLDKANSEIVKFIKKTDGVYTKKRYLEIARKLKDVSSALKENVGNNIDLDGLIDYELKKQKSLLETVKGDIVKAKGGVVNFLYPTREQIKTAALFKPVTEGFTYDSYLNGIEAGLYNTWDSAVRTGYLTGQPTKQIVSKVLGGVSPETKLKNPGLMQTLRNSVYGNTRTVLQSFANETRNRIYEENEDIFGDKDAYKYEWLSVLDSRSCLVCGNLDGKLFKAIKDAPTIPLHRGCVLGDTLVSTTSGISKVYKRRYKGLLYRITTASGNALTVTPNHPVLTDKGFVRAHLLNVGDNIISDNGLETLDIVSKDKNNRKALIQDVFRAFSKSPSMFACTMPLAPEDFHGDAVYKKVDIVSTNWKLIGESDFLGKKNVFHNCFINGFFDTKKESVPSRVFERFKRIAFTSFCHMGGMGKAFSFLWACMTHPFKLLFVWIPKSDIVPFEERNHGGTTVPKPLGNSRDTDSLIVKFKNLVNRKIVRRAFSRSADIGVVQDVSDDVFGRTVLARNILDRYSAQIKVDNIVAIDVKFSFTHVYNLETKNNWYIANGIITHNCRCILLPYFNIEGDTRASKDGYVSSKVTYSDWLGEQDEKTQLDVLGRTRFELYRRGENISQFIDSGKVLSLEQLNEKIDIKAILSKNIHEPDKENLSDHVVNERFMERGVTLDDVIDAIDNPLKRYPVRVSDGAYRIVGKKATIGVSAFDGKITTVWKTSDKKVKKLMEMLRDEDSE